nr:MAG TPA: Rho termination factor, N-terminal domain [Caudoviricetes sp.]
MKILIINLTNEPVSIVLADTSKAVLTPHKPYILDSFHRPEINYWTNCTDSRFKVIVDQAEVLRYCKVEANRAKGNSKIINTETVAKQVDIINNDKDEVIANQIIEDSNIDVVKTADTTLEDNVAKDKEVKAEEVVSHTFDLDKEGLENMSVASLKVLANKLEVKLPVNAKKKEIIEILLNAEA